MSSLQKENSSKLCRLAIKEAIEIDISGRMLLDMESEEDGGRHGFSKSFGCRVYLSYLVSLNSPIVDSW
jgi:hypothetical protein